MIRILLVDDHASLRESLAFMLEQEPDMTVLAQAETLAEARRMLGEAGASVDLAIIDLDLPDGSGADLIGDLHRANRGALALVLTAYSERERIARAVESGAAGVLHKSTRISGVIDAARRLVAGESLLSTAEVVELSLIAGRRRREDEEARSRIERLTPREREVLQTLADGLSDKEIAGQLYIGVGTVQTHVVRILAKLEVSSRLQAVMFAVRNGAVEVDGSLRPGSRGPKDT